MGQGGADTRGRCFLEGVVGSKEGHNLAGKAPCSFGLRLLRPGRINLGTRKEKATEKLWEILSELVAGPKWIRSLSIRKSQEGPWS